ncbi:MAG: hypothetical protein JOZ41_11770 [Chloroflexi bacterium]|nr:hypothetical protein [Chloroflexota bacterium]
MEDLPTSPAVQRLNTRIAALVKEAQPDELVDILMGSAGSLLRLADQQQQQQQQQVRRPTAEAPV